MVRFLRSIHQKMIHQFGGVNLKRSVSLLQFSKCCHSAHKLQFFRNKCGTKANKGTKRQTIVEHMHHRTAQMQFRTLVLMHRSCRKWIDNKMHAHNHSIIVIKSTNYTMIIKTNYYYYSCSNFKWMKRNCRIQMDLFLESAFEIFQLKWMKNYQTNSRLWDALNGE